MSLSRKSLPMDIMNIILEYASHLEEKTWYLQYDVVTGAKKRIFNKYSMKALSNTLLHKLVFPPQKTGFNVFNIRDNEGFQIMVQMAILRECEENGKENGKENGNSGYYEYGKINEYNKTASYYLTGNVMNDDEVCEPFLMHYTIKFGYSIHTGYTQSCSGTALIDDVAYDVSAVESESESYFDSDNELNIYLE